MGYEGNNCQTNTNECNSNPCQHEAICYDLLGSYQCTCTPGYTGMSVCKSYEYLPLIAELSLIIWENIVLTCPLNRTLTLSGTNCETNINECEPDPCRHGSCIDGINHYECKCEVPFTGKNCSEEMNPCTPNTCRNGAQCVPESNYRDYNCQCKLGFTGIQLTTCICYSQLWEPVITGNA